MADGAARDEFMEEFQRMPTSPRETLGARVERHLAGDDDDVEEFVVELYETVKQVVRRQLADVRADTEARLVGARADFEAAVKRIAADVNALEKPALPENFDAARASYRAHERVIHRGGTWICVAAAGSRGEAPGPDARTWLLLADGVADMEVAQRGGAAQITVRFASGGERVLDLRLPEWRTAGAFYPTKAYAVGDVVSHEGNSFVARRNNPGGLQGDGWQRIASRGETGAPAGKAEIVEMEGRILRQLERLPARSALERCEEQVEPVVAGILAHVDHYPRKAHARRRRDEAYQQAVEAALTVALETALPTTYSFREQTRAAAKRAAALAMVAHRRDVDALIRTFGEADYDWLSRRLPALVLQPARWATPVSVAQRALNVNFQRAAKAASDAAKPENVRSDGLLALSGLRGMEVLIGVELGVVLAAGRKGQWSLGVDANWRPVDALERAWTSRLPPEATKPLEF